MASSGRPLSYLLRAGDWRSGAVRAYLDLAEIDDAAMTHALVDASDSDDDVAEAPNARLLLGPRSA